MMHRSTNIDKIPKLSSTVPGDSNAFQVGIRGDQRDDSFVLKAPDTGSWGRSGVELGEERGGVGGGEG